MRIPLPECLKPPRRKLTPADVIRAELQKAHELHPAYLMPGAVISALEDADFVIRSVDEIEDEIALAYQAGYADGSEA